MRGNQGMDHHFREVLERQIEALLGTMEASVERRVEEVLGPQIAQAERQRQMQDKSQASAFAHTAARTLSLLRDFANNLSADLDTRFAAVRSEVDALSAKIKEQRDEMPRTVDAAVRDSLAICFDGQRNELARAMEQSFSEFSMDLEKRQSQALRELRERSASGRTGLEQDGNLSEQLARLSADIVEHQALRHAELRAELQAQINSTMSVVAAALGNSGPPSVAKSSAATPDQVWSPRGSIEHLPRSLTNGMHGGIRGPAVVAAQPVGTPITSLASSTARHPGTPRFPPTLVAELGPPSLSELPGGTLPASPFQGATPRRL